MIEQIPTEQWEQFLEAYTRQHRGWLASLEVISRDGKHHVSVMDQRFNGARIEDADRGRVVLLNFGDLFSLTRSVVDPSALLVEKTPANGDRGFDIQTADGSAVRMTFRVPAEPELVDGIASPAEVSY